MKVLIVEDNERNLKLVRDVLSHAGWDVVACGSGEEGVELARSERPDAVLMDINLPGMSGVEALGALRAAGVTRAGLRADRLRDEGGPRAAARGRLRRLPREAGQRPRAAGPGRGAASP